jgi:hypothetical protein
VQSIAHSEPTYTQATVLAPPPAEQQRQIAQDVDFSNTTVREVREAVKEKQAESNLAVHFSIVTLPKRWNRRKPEPHSSDAGHHGGLDGSIQKAVAELAAEPAAETLAGSSSYQSDATCA